MPPLPTEPVAQLPFYKEPYRLLKLLLITGIIWTLYGTVLEDLFSDWWNVPALSQGLLIPPLALYIAWLRRKQTLAVPVTPSGFGLVIVAAACALFILGKLAAEFFLARISFVVLLAGLVWTFWGAARFRTLLFPFLLLATMVPLPTLVYNALTVPLQLLASRAATEISRYCGVAVYQDGNIIRLATVTLGVEEACSGLSSLSSLMVASVLLGFLYCGRVWARVTLFLLSLPISVGVNIIRVAGSAILADYNQKFAMGFYHLFSGWLVFVFGALFIFAVTRILGHFSQVPSQ